MALKFTQFKLLFAIIFLSVTITHLPDSSCASENEIQSLSRQLSASNPKDRQRAVHFLSNIDNPKATLSLIRALKDKMCIVVQ